MTNPCQDPTPEQEAMYELHGEIAYLKEQLADAVRIAHAVRHKLEERGRPYEFRIGAAMLMLGDFLDQNSEANQ